MNKSLYHTIDFPQTPTREIHTS